IDRSIRLTLAALALGTACSAKRDNAAAEAPKRTDKISADEGELSKIHLSQDKDQAGGDGKLVAQAAEAPAAKTGLKVNLPSSSAATLDAGGGSKAPEGPTRAWFPETFLFEPLVVTDA